MDDKIEISEYDKLRIIYNEIIRGFTYSDSSNLYIKHLTEIENIEIVKKRHLAFVFFSKEGISTHKQRLAAITENGTWTKEEEERLEDLKQIIIDNEKNLQTIIPQQRSGIEKMIQANKIELLKLVNEKRELIGQTVEEYAEKTAYNYLIYLSFLKSEDLKERYFKNEQEIEELDFDEMNKFTASLESALSQFKEENVRKVSVLPFFINPLSFCKENIHTFLDKPFSALTSFQFNLISLGSRNLNIISEASGEPPALKEGGVNIQELIDWYDQNYSIILGKRSLGNNGGITKTERIV